MSNPIQTENQNTGSTGWQFSNRSNTAIQAYCDKASYNTGDTVTFYASTQTGGTGYSIAIYRLGWYGGNGGRLITTLSGLTGQAQGYWDGTTLQNCPTVYTDSTTHLIETGWSSSTTWTVPGTAVTGIYLAMFTDANTAQTACGFVVKGNTTADYVVVRPACSDAAYNDWGGWSLYTNPGTGVKVSILRPNVKGGGAAGILTFEIPAIHWFEAQGYNLSYITDIDCYTNASQLSNYSAILILGHNEYWTKQYRDGMETAIAAGVGAAFLGANASYWQCRIENDHTGTIPNVTVVCYKVSTNGGTLSNDPQYGVNNTLVTAQWRDSILHRPENTMIGIMYSSVTSGSNAAWTVDSGAGSISYLAGTGLSASSSYGSDLVGYEWDKQQAGGPSNLQVIGTSTITGGTISPDTSNTTCYIASGGALVFGSGSVAWTWALDTFRYTGGAPGSVAVVPQMQALMTNIMTALIRPKNQTGFSGFSSHM